MHLPRRLLTMLALAAGCSPVAACDRAPPTRPAAAVDSAVPPRQPRAGARVAVDTTLARPVRRQNGDRCRWADPAPLAPPEADADAPYDEAAMRRGVALLCALRDGGPEVRVVVGGGFSIPMGVDVFFPAAAPRSMQTLALDNDQPAYRGSDLLVGEDLNDDGWTDLRVQTWSGSGGIVHDVFTWNPRRSRFEQDSVFRGGSDVNPVEGRPCVYTSHRSGTAHSDGAEYCWAAGRWRMAERWTRDWHDTTADGRGGVNVRTTEELAGGKVRRVRVDTLPERGG